MKVEVSSGIEELKRQFSSASFAVREDGQGGAYVVIDPVLFGPKYRPETTWIGFHIPPPVSVRRYISGLHRRQCRSRQWSGVHSASDARPSV